MDNLQQILFYRELGFKLDKIKEIITDPGFDELEALREHRRQLLERREQLDALIANVEKTIVVKERGMDMADQEKFEGFKRRLIQENEKKYGEEIRSRWGDEAIDRSYSVFKGMSKADYEDFEALSQQIIDLLVQAVPTEDPGGEVGQRIAKLHREWITKAWGSYSPEAHAGLARMYVDDERFTQYYDQHQPGAAKFLRDAILILTGEDR